MSQRWKDESGREWIARISIEQADKMRRDGFNLLDPKQVGQAFEDPFQVFELLALIHQEQIEQAGITSAQFVELVAATEEVANSAAAALEAALADFFRRLRRPALAAVVTKASEATNAAQAAAIERTNSPRFQQAIAAETNRALKKIDDVIDRAITGATSGESPAS